MSMYQMFSTDPDLEKNGVVVDYGTFRLTLARAGGANKAFQRCLEAESAPFRRAIQSGTMDPARAEHMLRTVYSKTIVKLWEVQRGNKWVPGLDDPEGGDKPLPFNEKNVIAALSNPRLHDLWEDVRDQSGKMLLYRSALLEADAGN